MPSEGRVRNSMGRRGSWRRHAGLGALLAAGSLCAGCLIAPFLRSEELKGSHSVAAKYTGLEGKSFAVVVAADRVVQADFPQLLGQLTVTIAERLKQNCGATGYVPGDRVLQFQYQNPRWSAMTLEELSKELGVDRLVFVDVQEFRLTDPGNQYLWAGVASGNVGVVEADGMIKDNFGFQQRVSVAYPDKTGFGPEQLSGADVELVLAKRLVDRTSWLFYTHDEKKTPDY